MGQPTLTSYQIRDLAPGESIDDPNDVLPSDARLRCFWNSFFNEGIAAQIVGQDLNVFCTQGSFVWDLDTQSVDFIPGFSPVIALEAVWDPTTITMEFLYKGESIGQISAKPSQPIEKPLTGTITLLLNISMSDGSPSVPLPYLTAVSVQGFPADPAILTWGDWVSRGAYEFPMAVRLVTPDVLELPTHLSVVAQYGTLADPQNLVVVNPDVWCGKKQSALVFPSDQSPVSLYAFAQYQRSQYVTLIPIDP